MVTSTAIDTLTFTLNRSGIKDYTGSALTATLPVSVGTAESLIASTPIPLTEATLDGSRVTLTLWGRTFENNIGRNLSVSGISGVTLGNIQHISDTQVTARLEFNGNFDRDGTLTFTLNQAGIKNYTGSDFAADLRVTATVESLTATALAPLTEATLHNSTMTLTLRGRTFENNIRPHVSVSGISGVTLGNVRPLSNTEVEVPLNFNGDFDRDNTLTFTVRNEGIKNYNGSDLTATIHVTATVETQTPVAPTPEPNVVTTPQPNVVTTPEPNIVTTPQPNVVTTPEPNIVTTPQPSVVHIPDANLRAAIQGVIGNTITTQTMLNLTELYATALGITNLTGLEHATNLWVLYLDDNNISDISPLSGLTQLNELFLESNNISDISPLVGLPELYELYLQDNPLNAAAINTHIPAMQANGVYVGFDNPRPTTPPDEDGMAMDNPQVDTRTPTCTNRSLATGHILKRRGWHSARQPRRFKPQNFCEGSIRMGIYL